MKNESEINQEWTSNLPHSFGGKYRSYQYYVNTPKHTIEEAFKRNDIYTRYYQYRRARYNNPVYVYRKREQFQADVIFFSDPLMVKASKNMKYLLVIIDVFTKFVFLFPLKQIKGENVAKCFQSLFINHKPEKITTDAGKEFLNKHVKKVIDDFHVKHYVAKGRTKACIAERFNLTIQRLIFQLCRFHNTNNWCSDIILKKATEIYHNRFHHTIKMSPTEAEKEINQSKIRNIYIKKYRKADEKKKNAKFKEGDTVRISTIRKIFDRGYQQNFTTEVWKIHKILNNLPLPRYIVKDENDEILDSILNENELIHYIPSGIYEIEKILDTRWRNKRKEYLIRWLHYSKDFDSWIPAKSLESVK